MIVLWVVAALAFAVAEVMTLALFAAFLAAAAAGAAVVAWLGGGLLAQSAAFLVLAIAGIGLARPLLMGYMQRRRAGPTASGAQELIGLAGVVAAATPAELAAGRLHVQLMGERWPARTADGAQVKPGDEVRVTAISGATLIVAAGIGEEA